jgi:hypothetical protein
MIINAGEISLVEYGKNEIVGWIRTEKISPHLISVRLNESRKGKEIRRVAYLLDVHTISIGERKLIGFKKHNFSEFTQQQSTSTDHAYKQY